jgi:hypothetical protein
MLEVQVGEVYRMRRKHPCGGWEWRVYRTGADIGIECLTCGRRTMLERRRFESRSKARVAGGDGPGS